MVRTVTACVAMGVLLGSTSASFADAFATVVQKVLMQDEQVKGLEPARQKEMIACATKALANVPPPTKRKVAQAANLDEMQDRFGQMVMADRAKYQKEITAACGEIMMNK